MTVSAVIAVALTAAVVLAIASVCAYRAGRAYERDRSPRMPALFGGCADADSIDGERRMLAMLEEAVLIADAHGNILAANAAAGAYGIVTDGHLTDDGVRGLIADAATAQSEAAAELAVTDGARMRRIAVRAQPIGDGRTAVVCADTGRRRDAERMRREFVTNVSHELKTPVGAIMLLAETIDDAGDDVEMIRHFAGRIGAEAKRLDGLVRRLIELGRMQDDGAREPRLVDVRDVVAGAIADTDVAAAARHTDVRMRDDAAGVPLTVAVDASGMRTAVKNLVENAIHYSPEHASVTVAVDAVDGAARIRVVDHGVGIPPALQQRIFERFYRVDPARSRLTGGTGLGLSIARHHILASGGKMDVWSKPGEGSTFTVVVPLAPPNAPDTDKELGR